MRCGLVTSRLRIGDVAASRVSGSACTSMCATSLSVCTAASGNSDSYTVLSFDSRMKRSMLSTEPVVLFAAAVPVAVDDAAVFLWPAAAPVAVDGAFVPRPSAEPPSSMDSSNASPSFRPFRDAAWIDCDSEFAAPMTRRACSEPSSFGAMFSTGMAVRLYTTWPHRSASVDDVNRMAIVAPTNWKMQCCVPVTSDILLKSDKAKTPPVVGGAKIADAGSCTT
mmetsp:Transcript_31448/g.97150  ORF Transcript_31448/g.97150 Transcript_31448/m.97150 type:complete len:223 (+) Transcript_31448:305-973(+)